MTTPRLESKRTKEQEEARVQRVWDALRKCLRGISVSVLTDDLARVVLAAADEDLVPEANTCSPSTEGLLSKEIEDHG